MHTILAAASRCIVCPEDLPCNLITKASQDVPFDAGGGGGSQSFAEHCALVTLSFSPTCKERESIPKSEVAFSFLSSG